MWTAKQPEVSNAGRVSASKLTQIEMRGGVRLTAANARRARAWWRRVLSARYGAQLYRGDALAAAATRAELGRLAHAHQWPLVIWVHGRLVVQDHIMHGDFAAASTALEGLERSAQRWPISFAAEMHPVLKGLIALETHGIGALAGAADADADSLRRGLLSAPVGLRPMLGRLQLELGDRAAAAAVLAELSTNDFAEDPRDIGYLSALASLAWLAVRLDDRPRAERLYALLAPYSEFNTMTLLLLREGSVSHFLGVLAAFLRMPTAAAQHFDQALAMNERMALRPQIERTRRERDRWTSTASREGSTSSFSGSNVRPLSIHVPCQ